MATATISTRGVALGQHRRQPDGTLVQIRDLRLDSKDDKAVYARFRVVSADDPEQVGKAAWARTSSVQKWAKEEEAASEATQEPALA